MLPMEICERDVRRPEQNSSKHSRKLGTDVERFNKRSGYETLLRMINRQTHLQRRHRAGVKSPQRYAFSLARISKRLAGGS